MSKKELAIGVLGAGGNIGHTHSQNIATYVDGARLGCCLRSEHRACRGGR